METINSTNKLALLSFAAAGLTLFTLCVGVIPIPFSAWLCFPLALILGVIALSSGSRAIRQVRKSGEKGRRLAMLGIWAGLLVILVVTCLTAFNLVLVYFGVDAIIGIWHQFQP